MQSPIPVGPDNSLPLTPTTPPSSTELATIVVASGNLLTVVRKSDGAARLQFNSGNGALNLINGGLFQISSVQVVGARAIGWTAQTTPLSRADMGATPALQTVANTLSALISDLVSHGLIGP